MRNAITVNDRLARGADDFAGWFSRHCAALTDELVELVRCNTTSPREAQLFPLLESMLDGLGATFTRLAEHPGVREHPLRSRCAPPPGSDGKHGVRAFVRGDGDETVLISGHVDVVPVDEQFADEQGVVRDGRVFGRGSADTKGNLVAAIAALRFLADAGRAPAKSVLLDFVIEEEIGGNGALSSSLHGFEADACVVLEPTSLEVFCGHRGCVGFTVTVEADATHMGAARARPGAIDGAAAVVTHLRRWEAELIDAARSDPWFVSWDRPLQLNIGSIRGGEWHGSVASRCTVSGNLGFLPPATVDNAKRSLRAALAPLDVALTVDFDGLHNGGYVLGASPVVEALWRAGAESPRGLRAWNVSCDARTYFDAGVPPVVFGAGALDAAHSDHESIEIADVGRAAEVVAALLTDTVPIAAERR